MNWMVDRLLSAADRLVVWGEWLEATYSRFEEWCREESCEFRHWRSGSMPTHKRGDACPQPVQVEVTDDMVTRAYRAQHIAEWGDDLDPEDIGTPSDRAAMRAALSAALGGDHE